jgi:threonine aldolase
MPDSEALRDRFHFYVWNGDEVRLMCSWDTTVDQVDQFLAAVRAG